MVKSTNKKLYFVVQGDLGYGDIQVFDTLEDAKKYVEDSAEDNYFDNTQMSIYEADSTPIKAKISVEWE